MGRAFLLGTGGGGSSTAEDRLVPFLNKSISELRIAGLSKFSAYQFYGQESLKKLTITDSIYLPNRASCVFWNCKSLSDLLLNGNRIWISTNTTSYYYLGRETFFNCYQLSSLPIITYKPSYISSGFIFHVDVDEYAFCSCAKITCADFEIDSSLLPSSYINTASYFEIEAGNSAFANCYNLRSLPKIRNPWGVETRIRDYIGNYAFYGCSKLGIDTGEVWLWSWYAGYNGGIWHGSNYVFAGAFASNVKVYLSGRVSGGVGLFQSAGMKYFCVTSTGLMTYPTKVFADCRYLEAIHNYGSSNTPFVNNSTGFGLGNQRLSHIYTGTQRIEPVSQLDGLLELSGNYTSTSTIFNGVNNCKQLKRYPNDNYRYSSVLGANVRNFSYLGLEELYFYSLQFLSHSALVGMNCLSKLAILSLGSICSMSGGNGLNTTPICQSSYLGYFGSVYVPRDLVSGYKVMTNWVSYSNRICAAEDYLRIKFNIGKFSYSTMWNTTWQDFLSSADNTDGYYEESGSVYDRFGNQVNDVTVSDHIDTNEFPYTLESSAQGSLSKPVLTLESGYIAISTDSNTFGFKVYLGGHLLGVKRYHGESTLDLTELDPPCGEYQLTVTAISNFYEDSEVSDPITFDFGSSGASNFATDSWETISKESKRLSWYYRINDELPSDMVYSSGDEREVTNSDLETRTFVILGFCHDKLTEFGYDPDYKGNFAGITIGYKSPYSSLVYGTGRKYYIDKTTALRIAIESEFSKLPQEIRDRSLNVVKNAQNSYLSYTLVSVGVPLYCSRGFALTYKELIGQSRTHSTDTGVQPIDYFPIGDKQYDYFAKAPVPVGCTPVSGLSGTYIYGTTYFNTRAGFSIPYAIINNGYSSSYVYYINSCYSTGYSSYYMGNISYQTSSVNLGVILALCI